MLMHSNYHWVPVDTHGYEHYAVRFTPALHADGVVLGTDDDGPFRIRYQLQTDDDFCTRAVHIERFGVAAGGDWQSNSVAPDSLSLSATGDGSWTIDGGPAPELNGCLDVDIAVTPLSNTLPIRRLGLHTGESETTEVVYIDPRRLDVSRAKQRYTCLERSEDGGRYRYESLTTGFSVEIDVDSNGVVGDYPGVFRQVR